MSSFVPVFLILVLSQLRIPVARAQNLEAAASHMGFKKIQVLNPQELTIGDEEILKLKTVFSDFYRDFPGSSTLASGQEIEWSFAGTHEEFQEPELRLRISKSDLNDLDFVRFKIGAFLIPKIFNFYLKDFLDDEFRNSLAGLENSWLRFFWAQLYVLSRSDIKSTEYRFRLGGFTETHEVAKNELLWKLEYSKFFLPAEAKQFKEWALAKALNDFSLRRLIPPASKPGLGVHFANEIFKQIVNQQKLIDLVKEFTYQGPRDFKKIIKKSKGKKSGSGFEVYFFSFEKLAQKFFPDQKLDFQGIESFEIDWISWRFRVSSHDSHHIWVNELEGFDTPNLRGYFFPRSDFPQEIPDLLKNHVSPQQAIQLPSTQHTYQVERRLKDYRENLHWEFSKSLDDLATRGGHWIDMGSGEGVATEDFHHSLGPSKSKVQLTGITLEMKRKSPSLQNLTYLVGLPLQELDLRGFAQADIVTDLHGVLAYSYDVDQVLSIYLSLLKEQGGVFALLTAEQYVETTEGRTLTLAEWIAQIPGLKVDTGSGSQIWISVTDRSRIRIPKLKLSYSDSECPPNRFFKETGSTYISPLKAR